MQNHIPDARVRVMNGGRTSRPVVFTDAPPDLDAVLTGLLAAQKRLPSKYFYDQHGSALFDAICELDEYYLTRTELALMHEHGDEIARLVGPRAAVVELGAGSTTKVRLLLDCLIDPAAYVPVDVSGEYLAQQAEELAADYPKLRVEPVVADFTRPFELPAHAVAAETNLVFFPGSTIGNLGRSEAQALLATIAAEVRPGGGALIGVDLRKSPRVLEAAYNDSRGVTAAFNLNMLARLNRDLGTDFDVERFRHQAVYDTDHGRIEMRLVSLCAQTVTLAGVAIPFRTGEYIVTEHSHKYALEEFSALAQSAGFAASRSWVDDEALFSVHYLEAG